MPGASVRTAPVIGNLVHGLLDDLQAFAHFRDANHVAAIAIGIACASEPQIRILRSWNTGKTLRLS